MDRNDLIKMLYECQFRNCLYGSTLDSIAFNLVGEAVENSPELYDPDHYTELKPCTDLDKICLQRIPGGTLLAGVPLGEQVDRLVADIHEAYRGAVLKYSGRILSGTVRGHLVPAASDKFDMILTFITTGETKND